MTRMLASVIQQRNRRWRRPIEIIGSSESIRAVQKSIGRLADNDATVLIMGETGTGKELVARAIHEYGNRNWVPSLRSIALRSPLNS